VRAHLVVEKFMETSDPVADMGVGGFILESVYNEIKNDAAKRWINFLKDNLEGCTIRGKMSKWEEKGHIWKEYEIFVKKVVNDVKRHGFEYEVTVKDDEDKYYTLSGIDKIYIIN
jgi:hypothetical protein